MELTYRKSKDSDEAIIKELIALRFGNIDSCGVTNNLDGRYTLAFDGDTLVAMTGLNDSKFYNGLELDWTCVVWDGDFRYSDKGWKHYSFKGSKWQNINKPESQAYQLNAYRVLLTRARQGMVLVIPEGNSEDHTRKPEFYDDTYKYLRSIGLEEI